MKSDELYSKISGMGYSITSEIDGESVGIDDVIGTYDDYMNDGNGGQELTFNLVGKKSKKEFLTVLLSLNEMPFCCGALALGGLEVTDNEDAKEGARELLIQYAFIRIKEYYMKAVKGKLPKGKLVTFISNGMKEWKDVEVLLGDQLADDFELVSTHINDNEDNNTLKTYIAKY